MATSNFLQWNPAQANQETDVAYAADSQRSGGAANPSIFPSATANKLFYQISTFVAAFAQMMVNKGITMSDANFANLVTALSNVQLYGDEGFVVVPFSATPAFDASLARKFELDLTGNVTSSTLVNVAAGMVVTFIIKQDAVGGRAFVWPPNVPGADVDTTANVTSVQSFIADNSLTLHPISPLTLSGGPY